MGIMQSLVSVQLGKLPAELMSPSH